MLSICRYVAVQHDNWVGPTINTFETDGWIMATWDIFLFSRIIAVELQARRNFDKNV